MLPTLLTSGRTRISKIVNHWLAAGAVQVSFWEDGRPVSWWPKEGEVRAESDLCVELHNGRSLVGEITIVHLLQHRSGFADVFTDSGDEFFALVDQDPQRQYSGAEMVKVYYDLGLHEAPRFVPGAGWHYSDMNYVLLGLLIEDIEGKSLAEVLRERIIDPLNLENTYFEFY